MNNTSKWSWYALLACVALTPLATTATSMQLKSMPLTYDSFVIPKLAALGLLAALASVLWAAGATTLRWHRTGWAMSALALVAVTATVFAIDPAVSFFGKDAANGLVAWLAYAAVFFLILQLTSSTPRMILLTRAVTWSAAAVSAVSVYQAAVSDPARLQALGLGANLYAYGRGGGVMGNPDYVGAFLVIPFMVALGLTLFEMLTPARVMAAGSAALIGTQVVIAQSRAAWLGVAVAVVVFVVIVARRHAAKLKAFGWWAALGGVALLAGLGVARFDLIAQRLSTGGSAGLAATSSSRLSGWLDALKVIAERWWLGTGPDAYTFGWYRVAKTLSDPLLGTRSYYEDPHNLYLMIASTMGVFALIAFVALLFFALSAGVKNLNRAKNDARMTLLFGAWLAGVVGMLVTSLFAVTTIPTMLVLTVGLAMLVAPSASAVDGVAARDLTVRGAMALVALVCVVGATMAFSGDFRLGQAMRRGGKLEDVASARAAAPWEKTGQLLYITKKRAALQPVLDQGGESALAAVEEFDKELFDLTRAHPGELLYAVERIDFMGQAGGLLGPAVGENTLTVINTAIFDYPALEDFKIAQARALNNLDRFDEAAAVLEPMDESVSRDIALAESYGLLKRDAQTKALIGRIKTRYPDSPLAKAFLEQPGIEKYLGE